MLLKNLYSVGHHKCLKQKLNFARVAETTQNSISKVIKGMPPRTAGLLAKPKSTGAPQYTVAETRAVEPTLVEPSVDNELQQLGYHRNKKLRHKEVERINRLKQDYKKAVITAESKVQNR